MNSVYSVIIFSGFLALIIISLGVLALKSDFRKKINQSFFALSLFMAIWAFLFVLSIFSQFSNLFSQRLTDVFGIFVAVELLHFALIYPKDIYQKTTKILYIVSLIFSIICVPFILFSSWIVRSVENEDSIARPILGVSSWPYFYIIYIILLMSVFILMYKYFKTYRYEQAEHRKLKFIVIGFGVTALIGALLNFSVLLFSKEINWSIEALQPFSSIIFIIFTAYGILKGGLFDVRTAIVRSVTYSLVLATMAGIYVGTTSLLSGILGFAQSGPAELAGNVVISLVLVILFQPLKKFFDKITNRIFYKDNYNTDEFFGRLNKTLAVTTDLRNLLEKTATEIGKTLKASQTFFYINTENNRHITAGTDGHSTINKTDADEIINTKNKTNGVIVASILDDGDLVKDILISHKIEVVLPLIQDSVVIGYLCLGEHLSSNYTTRDINVLDTISNELIIAIQNALSVQEIRDFNVTLKREIAIATQELRIKNALLKKLDKAKDEFVSMASHQLRTPLTSVKGYLSMVIEGDAGKLSENQKELLGQAFISNEKMVHLVNDFLNVSRIQTGKFMLDKIPTDLSKLVTDEIDGLRQNAKARNLNLVLTVPKKLPMLNIDEGKIRQVVMNFADNALYYSNANTDIHIDLAVDGDEVVYTVKDTGIGVPVSEQGQLFTKFYRASNARKQRPDGTGVGLYLAKKIVTAHDGKIVFETVEGKGSTFGFRLPIKELEVSSEEAYNLKD